MTTVVPDMNITIAGIDTLYAELQTRKPTEEDVARVLELLRDFSAVTECELLKAGEKQFGKSYIQ